MYTCIQVIYIQNYKQNTCVGLLNKSTGKVVVSADLNMISGKHVNFY